MKLIRMPSIPGLDGIVRDIQHLARYQGQDENDEPIYDNLAPLPVLKFKGTVKTHGTNASVCWDGENLWAQSKGNILEIGKDNYGFAGFVDKNKDNFKDLLKGIKALGDADVVTIYGEWIGKGIQDTVAVSEMERTFVMFSVKYSRDEEENTWDHAPQDLLPSDSENNIMSVFDYETFEIDIDFNHPKLATNKILELVKYVEDECPVGKHHGISGIGEGIVWDTWYKSNKFNFKTKGDKHSKSKVKKLQPVDNAKEQKKIDTAEAVTPGWRLQQGIQEVFDIGNGGEATKQGTGDYIRWVIGDVVKEEMIKIHDARFELKDIQKHVSTIAKNFFLEYLNEKAGL